MKSKPIVRKIKIIIPAFFIILGALCPEIFGDKEKSYSENIINIIENIEKVISIESEP